MSYAGRQLQGTPLSTIARGKVYTQQITGDGTTTVFGLVNTPSSIQHTNVFIQGIYQNKNQYSVSGSQITFNTAPGNTYIVEIQVTDTPVSSGGQIDNIVTNSAGTYSVSSWNETIIQTTTASIYTFPSAASYAGMVLHIVTQFAGAVTSVASNIVPLIGGSAGTAILAATAGKWAKLQSNGANWVIIASN